MLGILGGCGPAAGAHFYRRLVALTDATADSDHIPVLLSGDGRIPDRSAYLLGRSPFDPTPALIAAGRRLAAGGATRLCLLCHTAHAFLPAIEAALSVPVLDMVGLSVEAAAKGGCLRLGVLATEGTIFSEIYDAAAAAYGMAVVYLTPPLRAHLHAAIYDSLKCGHPDRTGILATAGEELRTAGAEAILLGCTELSLPLARRGIRFPLPVIDPVELLARHAVTLYGKRIKEEIPDAVDRPTFRFAHRPSLARR